MGVGTARAQEIDREQRRWFIRLGWMPHAASPKETINYEFSSLEYREKGVFVALRLDPVESRVVGND